MDKELIDKFLGEYEILCTKHGMYIDSSVDGEPWIHEQEIYGWDLDKHIIVLAEDTEFNS